MNGPARATESQPDDGRVLSIQRVPEPDGVVLTLRGELDLMSVPDLRAAVVEVDGNVEIDCADLTFIDSSGLGLLVMLMAQKAKHGHTLTLRNVSARCYGAFEVTGLTPLLDIQRS